jgi:hypothetical protein
VLFLAPPDIHNGAVSTEGLGRPPVQWEPPPEAPPTPASAMARIDVCPACGKQLSPMWLTRCDHCKTPFAASFRDDRDRAYGRLTAAGRRRPNRWRSVVGVAALVWLIGGALPILLLTWIIQGDSPTPSAVQSTSTIYGVWLLIGMVLVVAWIVWPRWERVEE